LNVNIDILSYLEEVGTQVAVTIGVYEVVILLSCLFLAGLVGFTNFIHSLNHSLHSVSGIGFDLINVVLGYSEPTWLVVLTPVNLTSLEDLGLVVANWEARVLFSDLLQHLNELPVLAKFHGKSTAPDSKLTSHVD